MIQNIEIVDKINDKIYHSEDEVIFHPLQPTEPIVMSEFVREFEERYEVKIEGSVSIVFETDGSTMILMKKTKELLQSSSDFTITYRGESSEKSDTIIRVESCGFGIINNHPSIILANNDDDDRRTTFFFQYHPSELRVFLKKVSEFLEENFPESEDNE